MESAKVCLSNVLQREKNPKLFLKQHPSASFREGQFSQVFEDERGEVSNLRNTAGIQPEDTDSFFSHARDAGTVKSCKSTVFRGGKCKFH